MTVVGPSVDLSVSELLEGSLFVDGDWVESKDQDPGGDVRLIQLADIGDGVFRDRSSRFLTASKAKELRCTFLEPGDVLVARMPEPLGRACIFPGVGQPAVTAVDVCIMRPDPAKALPEWLVSVINSPQFRSSMQQFVRGTTRQRISRRNLGSLHLAVPPTAVQAAMVEGIKRVDATRGSALTHLAAARRVSERLRQAVLLSACSGRLTADWRPTHADLPPASELLRSIDVARRDRLGKRFKARPPVHGTADLPEGWTWSTIGGLVEVGTGATPLRRRKDYYGGHIPWVTSGAVNEGTITKAAEAITELAVKETNAKVFPSGTLLVAMYGEGQTRGRVAELAIAAATNQALAALVFDDISAALRPFLKVFLLSNYERVRTMSFGGVQPNLSLGVIRDTLVPVPPVREQEEIVRRTESLLRAVERVEERLSISESRLDRAGRAAAASSLRGDLLGVRVTDEEGT